MKTTININSSPNPKTDFTFDQMRNLQGVYRCTNDRWGWGDKRYFISDGLQHTELIIVADNTIGVFVGHTIDKEFWLKEANFVPWHGKINITLEN